MASLDDRLNAGAIPAIAILRGIDPNAAADIGRVLVGAGITLLEVPLNSPRPLDSIAALLDAVGNQAVVGAGTVLTVDQVRDLARIGGQIAVSPNADPAVIGAARDHGIEPLPGVMSPTEAFAALAAGARKLKLFPASSLAHGHCKAMKEVLPAGTEIWAVGGVSADNCRDWIAAGCRGVGIGGSLFRPGDTPGEVAARARAIVSQLSEIRT